MKSERAAFDLHGLLRVARGETVEILDGSERVARIEPIPPAHRAEDERIPRLRRAGILQAPMRSADVRALLAYEPVPCDGDAVQVLIGQRGER